MTPARALAGSDLGHLTHALGTRLSSLLGDEAARPPSRARPVRSPEVRELDRNGSERLLAQRGVGPVVFDDGHRLAALPVSSAAERGEIVARTGAELGTVLAAASLMSLEVDRPDEVTGEDWSALVAGRVQASDDSGELTALGPLGAELCVGHEGLTTAVGVALDEVTGRVPPVQAGGKR